MNIEMYGVQELNKEEAIDCQGGNIWRTLERIAAALAIGDAVDEFVQGWNSCSCSNGWRGASGSW